MRILLNNKETEVFENTSVEELLNSMNTRRSVGVFINKMQILRNDFSKTQIKENDEVKILKILAGG